MVDFFHGSYAEENAILDSIYSFEDYWDGMLHGRKIVNVRLQIVNTAFVSSSWTRVRVTKRIRLFQGKTPNVFSYCRTQIMNEDSIVDLV